MEKRLKGEERGCVNRTQQDGEENRAGTGPSCDHGELSLTWEAGVQASRLLGKETLLLFLDQKKMRGEFASLKSGEMSLRASPDLGSPWPSQKTRGC